MTAAPARDSVVRVDRDDLVRFSTEVLVQAGLTPQAAADTAVALVFADCRGIASHGCTALPGYVGHIRKGGVNVSPRLTVLSEGPAYALVDGDNGIGPFVAKFATEIAIRKADDAGTATVIARNSNHFGAGAHYALMMARAGMIGEVQSNVLPIMAPTGGRERKIGNNPLSIAAPTAEGAPFVLDIAMSVVAGGRVVNAADAKATVPEGWILNQAGLPTTDPTTYLAGGALLPFGGYKGYGMALSIEVFAGVLGGGGMLDDLTSWRRNPESPSRTGHSFRATKIERFLPMQDYYQRMRRLVDEMKGSPRAEGANEILIPGELEFRAEQAAQSGGVRLAGPGYASLVELAAGMNLKGPVRIA